MNEKKISFYINVLHILLVGEIYLLDLMYDALFESVPKQLISAVRALAEERSAVSYIGGT